MKAKKSSMTTSLLRRFHCFQLLPSAMIKWLSLFLVLITQSIYSFDKVVIWGHKLHTHTHSYIHEAFYRAFKSLGYPTWWFDDNDELQNFDFANTLFITEGQVDGAIPLRDDCKYMLHNCTSPKYQQLNPKNWFVFQVYTKDVHSIPHIKKIDTCIYYDLPGRCLYMPWATDLLPDDIEKVKKNLPSVPIINKVFWVGTVGEGTFGNRTELNPFIAACQENGLEFVQQTHLEQQDHIQLIQQSYMAPTIAGSWQKSVDYVPCRIFKNVSYGKMGITNSRIVNELFEGRIVYNPDTRQLFYDAKKRMETLTLEEIYELMDFVKTKHTYINRIQLMLSFLELVGS
jgi:hypothetical protein